MIRSLREIYYLIKQIYILLKKKGSISYNGDIGCFVAKRVIKNELLIIPLKSRKVLTRFNLFDSNTKDIVFKWIDSLKNCKCFLDIGSANGMEGFYVSSKYNIKVILSDIFIPSLDDLIKTLYLSRKYDNFSSEKIDIFFGGFSNKDSIMLVESSRPPKSGYTQNLLSNSNSSKKKLDKSSLWLYSFTVDSFIKKTKNLEPSHIKIDVDGFEVKVVEGMKKTLSMHSTKEIMIELNDKTFNKINKIFSKNGFKEISRGLHQNGNFDVLYKRFN